MKTAVLFLTFNRLSTTKEVFSAIRKAKPPRLYLASDGARKNKQGEKEEIQAVRDYVVNSVDWKCDVKTLFRQKNLGCGVAISRAISWFFEHEEMGIILEDDCLPSQSFFPFCEELLIKYKDDMRVWTIGGFNILGKYNNNSLSYHFSTREAIWGWATWKRAWKHYDFKMKLWDEKYAKERYRDFLMYGLDFDFHKNVFDYTRKNIAKITYWSYQWQFVSRINSGLAIVPQVNLIKNIGFDAEYSTHTKNPNSKINKIKKTEISFPLRHPKCIGVNRELSELLFKTYYFLDKKKYHLILFDTLSYSWYRFLYRFLINVKQSIPKLFNK